MQKRTGTLTTSKALPLVFPGRVGYNFKKERKKVAPIGKRLAWVLASALLLTGCGSGQNDADQHFSLGDTVSTAWFDYTVTGIESTEEYGGYISAEGEQLVVVELSLKSTYPQPVTMFDSDFQLSWADMSQDDTRCMPVEYYCQQQLPSEYELAPRENRSGVLVYQVPDDQQTFYFTFQEIYDDGTEEGRLGDQYVMDLAPLA